MNNADTSTLTADRGQIERFVTSLFKRADPGTWVSLRGFTHRDDRPVGMHRSKGAEAKHVFPCERIVVGTLANVIDRAARGATFAANYREPAVFCPPVATFANDEHARGEDLANGLALSVECDQRSAAARATLEALLGPATIVMASGGEWTDPETGKAEKKLHLHWRLAEPTRTREDHERLRQARRDATTLVGGDTTAIHAVHPLRWAGSWHTKDPTRPRLAAIISESDREVHLAMAFDALRGACGEPPAPRTAGGQPTEHWDRLARGVDQGTTGRIGAVISVFGHLLARGIEPHLAVALARAYNASLCRPPLPEKKVEQALISIIGRERGRA